MGGKHWTSGRQRERDRQISKEKIIKKCRDSTMKRRRG